MIANPLAPAGAAEIEFLKVRLRLREPTRFRFQHGGVLHGLCCQLFGHDLPPDLFPLALESGHVAYAAGDAYDFVIGAAGKSRAHLREVEPALKVLSRQVRRLGAATLEGNFDFERAEILPRPSRDEIMAKAEAWESKGKVRLLFPAPLRLKLPPELGRPGAGYANQHHFPAALFLDRLWRRRYRLATGEFPPTATVPVPPSVKHHRAVVAALTPSALAILDEGAAFFRLGLSRHSATEGLRRAREAGFGAPVGGAGTDFVSRLDEKKVMSRLEALWPGEPLVGRLRTGNPEVAKLVGKLFAAELAERMQQEGKRLVRLGGQLRVWGREEAARAA